MKTFLIIGLAILFPSLLSAQIKVQYNIHYSPNILEEGLKVELTYSTKKSQDSIYLHYYNQTWGEDNLFNCMQILANENPTLSFSTVPDSNRIIVHYRKSKKVSLVYHIKQDFIGDSIELVNRPRMNDDYFHILGQELFVVPEDVFSEKENRIQAKINWIGFPENYIIHNTFGSKEKTQTVEGSLHSSLYHSLFVGGDYRLHLFTCHNKPVIFAIRGNWYSDYADDNVLLENLNKTIFTQREFWKDYSQEYYTVIMTPTVSQNDSLFKGQSATGSGLKNGFMIQSSNNLFNQLDVIKYMFNHELMHQWIGLTIRNAHEELNYWFSEGFTDYYTYKNRLRNGDISLEEWKNSFNEDVIQKHYTNPNRNNANYTIVDDFWKSRDVEKIPYRRGAIFAFWLDNKIMKASNYTKSLDDFMRVLLSKCKDGEQQLSDEFFLEEVRQFLNEEDISYEFQKYIIIGENLEFKNEDLIDCFGIELVNDVPQITLIEGKHQYIGK